MKIWKVGIIGCGNIAETVYIPQMKRINQAKITAVCDRNQNRAKEIADKFEIKESFCDVDEFLEKADVEIVLSVSAIQGRHEINMKALNAGKHVYSQKPFAPSVEKATEQIELAEKLHLKLSTAPVHRNRPEIKKTRKLIETGAIGNVSLMKIDCSHGGPEYYQFRDTDPSWFYKKGAGALNDLGVHAVDQVIALMGPAKSVSCVAAISEPTRTIRSGKLDGQQIVTDELPDNYVITLEFKSGALAVVTTGFVQKASRKMAGEIDLFGNRGTIHIDGGIGFEGVADMEMYVDIPESGTRGWLNPEAIKEPDQTEWFQAQSIEDLICAIENDCEPTLSPQHARHVIEILEAVPKAIETGNKVMLQTTC